MTDGQVQFLSEILQIRAASWQKFTTLPRVVLLHLLEVFLHWMPWLHFMQTTKHKDSSNMDNGCTSTPAELKILTDNLHETQLIPINSLQPCARTGLKVNVFVQVAEMKTTHQIALRNLIIFHQPGAVNLTDLLHTELTAKQLLFHFFHCTWKLN